MPLKTSPRLKLERAQKHILELKEGWNDFLAQRPYIFTFKDDLDTQERFWFLTKCDPAPASFSLVIGDALQNLRTALDHLVHRAIFKETNIWPRKRTICFPIGEDATKYPFPEFGGRVEGLGQSAKYIIASTKPYKGGNQSLWRMHSLNNLDKHQLLIVAANALTGHRAPPSVRDSLIRNPGGSYVDISAIPDILHLTMTPAKTTFPLQKGSELLRLPIAELEEYMSFTFDIAFQTPAEFEGTKVFDTLQSAASSVDNIIGRFEAENLV